MKYAIHTGCVANGACRELNSSAREVINALNIDVEELKSASCTGAGVVHEVDPLVADTINARTLAMVEKKGLDLMTICSTCQGVLTRVNSTLKTTPSLLKKVNQNLSEFGHQYNGKVEVKHLLWVLNSEYGLERLSKRVVKPLNGLRVAAFYGCYILRPSEYMDFEDADNPASLENVIKAIGAEPVYYSGRTRCCGFPIMMMNKNNSLSMAGNHLLEAKDKGADCMLTPCPLCHLSLDSSQPDAESIKGRKIDLPVLHLAQLIGLALGLDIDKLGLKKHIVSTKKVISKVLN